MKLEDPIYFRKNGLTRQLIALTLAALIAVVIFAFSATLAQELAPTFVHTFVRWQTLPDSLRLIFPVLIPVALIGMMPLILHFARNRHLRGKPSSGGTR